MHIERQLKSLLSFYFCAKYGEHQKTYLTETNYNYTSKNSQNIKRLIKTLEKTITLPSSYHYITHYATKYKNVPLWIATNALTFGQISKMYQYSPSDIRTKISLHFSCITEFQFHQFIRILACCRNICAHNERLFSFHVNEAIPNMTLHHKLKLPKAKDQYTIEKNDLFAIVIGLRYLIDNQDFKKFKTELKHLINSILKKCPHINREILYSKMGFPNNWENIARYKK